MREFLIGLKGNKQLLARGGLKKIDTKEEISKIEGVLSYIEHVIGRIQRSFMISMQRQQ